MFAQVVPNAAAIARIILSTGPNNTPFFDVYRFLYTFEISKGCLPETIETKDLHMFPFFSLTFR